MDSNWVVELSSKLVQEMRDLGQHQLEDMQANHQTKMEQIEAARWCSCHSGVQAGQAGGGQLGGPSEGDRDEGYKCQKSLAIERRRISKSWRG